MQTKASLVARLLEVLPADVVDCTPEACALAAQDIFTEAAPVAAVLRPRDGTELALAVATASAAQASLFPRGGGMSYTSGYLPRGDDIALSVDMSAFDRVLEINVDDMYVLVEAGCSWLALDQALAEKGLRTPFWGPLSGIQATIGGALSQNAAFWGSGRHGAAADSVLGLEITLVDGSTLRTGSFGRTGAAPFFRHHGPDLTGLFLGDCGALGIKTRVSLRLVQRPQVHGVATFGFKTASHLLQAMSDISRSGLASELFAFDSALKSERLKRTGLREDITELLRLMRNSGSAAQGLLNGLRTLFAGRGFLDHVDFPLHVMVEGRTDAAVAADLAALREIVAGQDGMEVEPSIPRILHATPFGSLKGIVGPLGERWVPIHVIVPHSQAVATYEAAMAIFADMQADFTCHGIRTGCLFAGVGTNGFLLELMFFWPDELQDLHRQTLTDKHQARLTSFPRNDAARALVSEARRRLRARFVDLGGCQFQIGKFYPYLDGLDPAAADLITRIKDGLDPDHRMNPGVLGLG